MIGRFLRHQFWKYVEVPFTTDYLRLLEREVLDGCETLLDVGCGGGGHVQAFTNRLCLSVGVDAFAPAVLRARGKGTHTNYVVADVLRVGNIFPPRSFDCVLAFDVIEHLEKLQGLRLLDDMERIARTKVIVFTPNGFLSQGAVDGNSFQVHRSGWNVAEMRARGYRIIGVHGWKPLLGEMSLPRWRPHGLWKSLSVITQPWVENKPERAFQIFCVKDISAQESAREAPVSATGVRR